jgi:hypothetical protein
MPPVTSDTILDWLQEAVESKKLIAPQTFLDAALKLVILLAGEHDTLVDLEQAVAKKKLRIMETQEKRNVAAAELEVEASDEYAALRRQKLRVDRINEYVLLAKKSATLGSY